MKLKFEPIDLRQMRHYLKLISECPQAASDYSIINLWGWAREYELEWAWENDLVWLKQNQPEKIMWAPVGPWNIIDWVKILNGFSEPIHFIRVPERLANILKTALNDRVIVKDAREHWDYLYEAVDLIELKGNRFHKKKNLLNQFKKRYDYTYSPFASPVKEQILKMQEDWCEWRDCESSELLAAENRVIERVITHSDKLPNLTGGAIYVEGEIVAYTIAEILANDTILIHFEKGNTEIKGVYQAINQIFLSNYPGEIKYVNREQDLGDSGIRKAKMSYNPSDFIKKFGVEVY